MNEDYKFEESLIESAFTLNKIDELSYHRILGMLQESDGEDLDQLLMINDELSLALDEYRIQKVSDRLVIGAEMIEAAQDPKEKARLMVHYNNLLKELSA